VRQLVQNDPRMQSAEFDVTWVDPFRRAAEQPEAEPVAQVGEQPRSESPAEVVIDPDKLGLVVTGIMIGSRVKMAAINGETCREGEVISLVDKRDKTVTYEFRILKINRQSVQVEMAGHVFMLEFMQPGIARGDEFQLGKRSRE
jgi:hypothetical protein